MLATPILTEPRAAPASLAHLRYGEERTNPSQTHRDLPVQVIPIGREGGKQSNRTIEYQTQDLMRYDPRLAETIKLQYHPDNILFRAEFGIRLAADLARIRRPDSARIRFVQIGQSPAKLRLAKSLPKDCQTFFRFFLIGDASSSSWRNLF